MVGEGQREGLSVSFLSSYPLILSPLPEQEQIVSFLDEKTSKIDDLIKKKEQKIELLKEYRTSLINRIITKGLNPDVPMKDSGVEWIGEIPSHWTCVKTNKVFHNLGSGTTPSSEESEYYEDGVHHWITTTDLNEGVVEETITKLTDRGVEDYPNLTLYPSNSIYISMYGGRIGKIGLSLMESYCNQSVCVLPNNDRVNNKFYYYWYLSSQEQLKLLGRGGGQPNINKEMIKEFPSVKLPLSEQEQIVSYLDHKTGEIDSTIDSEKKKIDLLKEYRQSLISSVITGKIKVVD
jgi:type I restriction enzyme S subunit